MNTKHITASLVLDSQLVSKHTFEFVKWCQNSSIINIDCLIKISKQEQSKYNLLSKYLGKEYLELYTSTKLGEIEHMNSSFIPSGNES